MITVTYFWVQMMWNKNDRSLMGNEIGSGLSFKSVCFDFRSTDVGSSVIGTRNSTDFDVLNL